MKNIVLIGIMGSGKTTISKLLALRLNRPVIDMDDYLEDKYSMTINEMFDISEDYFREKETECCEDVSHLDNYIVSTGGGIIKKQKNVDLLKKNGIIIYIDRPIDNIMTDVETEDRPLLKDGPEKLYALFDERNQLYLDACDYHLMNDGTLDEFVDKIIEIVCKQ